MRGSALRTSWVILVLGLLGFVAGCGSGDDYATPTGTAPQVPKAEAPPNAVTVVFPYGSEKKNWIREVTARFHDRGFKTKAGRPIFVDERAMGSGEQIKEVLEGRLKAHLVSPASAAFIRLGNAQSEARTGKPLVGKTKDLVLSPVVIAMWKPMAEAIGWGKKPVGWADILEIVRNEKGWGAYGYPQWGRFKFGHTHPEYSNSGLISLFAEVYAATGKQSGLTLEDIAKPETGKFLRDIERAVVHYGSSTGFFGRRLFGNGPEYLSAAVLYENMIIEFVRPREVPRSPVPGRRHLSQGRHVLERPSLRHRGARLGDRRAQGGGADLHGLPARG